MTASVMRCEIRFWSHRYGASAWRVAARLDGLERSRSQMPAAPFPVERLHANDDDDDDDDRPAFIQRALLPDESSSEDDDDDAASPPVLNIACAACSTHLTRRGMQVFLVADNSSLFSTDIPSDDIREGGNHPIETCQCQASSVHCRGCDAVVGYHVTTVCGLCGDAEHNGHFWLFTEQHVSHSERGLTWDALPYNGQDIEVNEQQATAAAAAMDDAQDDDDCCPICAASPMWRPTRFPACGHRFCFGCASREVDMRGRCPLDRIPATREQLVVCQDAGPL